MGEFPNKSTQFSSTNQPEKNGRPKKIPEIDTLLADVLGEDMDGMEAAKKILEAVRTKALKGDVRAAEVLLDRAYGKAKQFVEQNNLYDADSIKKLSVEFINGKDGV